MAASKLGFLGFVLLFLGVDVLNASVIEVTGFTQIAGAAFYDAPQNSVLSPQTIGAVTITFQPTQVNAVFGYSVDQIPQHGPDVPGDAQGFGSLPNVYTDLILNFSQPVAAFGATFLHFFEGIGISNPADLPVRLEVFSGPDGTGTLLGTIIDSTGGVRPPRTLFEDFRGLWSSDPDIRSALISATSQPYGGFLVDGYAISVVPVVLEPVPEPKTLLLLAGCSIGLAIALRRKSNCRFWGRR
jgi:hypothetical protein